VVPANREEGTAGGNVGGEGDVLGVRGRTGVAAVQGGPLPVRNAECLGEIRDPGGPVGVVEEGGVGAVEDPEERVCGGDVGAREGGHDVDEIGAWGVVHVDEGGEGVGEEVHYAVDEVAGVGGAAGAGDLEPELVGCGNGSVGIAGVDLGDLQGCEAGYALHEIAGGGGVGVVVWPWAEEELFVEEDAGVAQRGLEDSAVPEESRPWEPSGAADGNAVFTAQGNLLCDPRPLPICSCEESGLRDGDVEVEETLEKIENQGAERLVIHRHVTESADELQCVTTVVFFVPKPGDDPGSFAVNFAHALDLDCLLLEIGLVDAHSIHPDVSPVGDLGKFPENLKRSIEILSNLDWLSIKCDCHHIFSCVHFRPEHRIQKIYRVPVGLEKLPWRCPCGVRQHVHLFFIAAEAGGGLVKPNI